MAPSVLVLLILGGVACGQAPEPRLDRYGDPLPPGAVLRLGTVRLRHPGWPSSVVFARDGKTLFTAHEDGRVRAWDVATGKPLFNLRVAEGEVRALALAPDGKTLAAGGYEGIGLWNLEKRRLLYQRKTGPVGSLTFTHDGKTLISGSGEDYGVIQVWDVTSGKERRRRPWLKAVSDLFVTADDRTLIAVSRFDNQVHLVDLQAGADPRTLPHHKGADLHAVLLTPDSKSLIVAGGHWPRGGDNFIEVCDRATGKLRRTLPRPQATVSGAALTPDGKTLVVSENAGRWLSKVRVWDLGAGKELRAWDAQGSVRAVSPDGKTLALADAGATHLWDLATGKPLHQHEGQRGEASSVSFSPDGKWLASCSVHDNTVRVWDLTAGGRMRVLPGHVGAHYVRAVQFLPDGRFVSGGSDNALRLWDPATGKEVRHFPLHGWQQVLSLAATADGKQVMCSSTGFGGSGQHLTVFDVATGKEVFHHHEKVEEDKRFEWWYFSPDGKRAAQHRGRALVVRDLTTGRDFRRFEAPDNLDGPCAFSPDGKTLAARGKNPTQVGAKQRRDDYRIRLFEVATSKERWSFPTDGWRQPLVFAPDGKTLAVGVGKGIALWDTSSGKEVWRSPELGVWVRSLAFSADGRRLASGLIDTTILIWDLPHRPERKP
ncbi:MAG: WD40 repeat domain-containing protein [Gemmataceae bacterium]|nr:WD40 repeat domain-containing protein [Gemmataceae bacterium]